MLKYPCLVLDHDDTVVQSEATVNYPFFVYILDQFRPGTTITLEEYVEGCCHLGFADMCRKWNGFTDQELVAEYKKTLESVFGDGSVYVLRVRKYGAVCLDRLV